MSLIKHEVSRIFFLAGVLKYLLLGAFTFPNCLIPIIVCGIISSSWSLNTPKMSGRTKKPPQASKEFYSIPTEII